MEQIIKNLNYIDGIYGQPQQIDIPFLEEAIKDPVETAYIFQKLYKEFNIEWFRVLYDLDAFNLNSIPSPTQYTDDAGNISYGFTRWEACFVIWEAAKFNEINGNLTKHLLVLINDYIDYSKSHLEDKNRNFTPDYYFCQFIMLLPTLEINDKHLNFIKNIGLRNEKSLVSGDLVDHYFKKVLIEKNEDLAFHLLEIFFTPSDSKNHFKLSSVIDDYYLENFVTKNSTLMFSTLGEKGIDWAVRKLEIISTDHQYPFLKINIVSLEPDRQNSSDKGLNVSLTSLVNVLMTLLADEPVIFWINNLLKSDSQVLKRIAFSQIDKRYSLLKTLFWALDNPLLDFSSKLEIYRLINRNCKSFTEEEITLLLSWISELSTEPKPEDTELEKKQTAYIQLEWLVALEPVHYVFTRVIDKYNDLHKITEKQVSPHPGYDFYTTFSNGGSYSTTKRIIDMSCLEVLNLLTNPERWEGYDVYGLQQDLTALILDRTQDIMGELDRFLYLPVDFLYNFIDAFRQLAEKKNTIDWQKFYGFTFEYITKRKDLWDYSVDPHKMKPMTIGMTAWLVKTQANNTEVKIDSHAVDLSVDILLQLEKLYSLEFTWLNNDPVFDIINSTRGKIYEAMISVCLEQVRYDNDKQFLDERVKGLFDKRLSDNSLFAEFYWTLGYYTPQISYLDYSWLKENKERIYIDDKKIGGNAAFNGYLLFSVQLYQDLYDLLFENYLSSIKRTDNSEGVTQKLVEHILIAFSINLHDAKTLMDIVLDGSELKVKYLVDRINYDFNLLETDQLIAFWKRITEALSNQKNRSANVILAKTSGFIEHLDVMDEETLGLFRVAIEAGGRNVQTYPILRQIRRKMDNGQYSTSAALILTLVKNENLNFGFDDEYLIQFIKELYQNNIKEEADQIAIAATLRKNFAALPVYNQYNQTVDFKE